MYLQKIMRKLCLTITIISILCAGCSHSHPTFTTEIISRGDIEVYCTATGTVNPLTTVLVGTQVSGRIKTILVDYNSRVVSGQLIAEIDPAPFEAQLEQARANLLSAQAALAKAQASLKDAARDWERKKALYREGGRW
jgi:HlyD family secretion protein